MKPPPFLYPPAETVPRSRRAALLGQKGATLWFTGLSASGKSSIAAALEQHLVADGRLAYRLDGDNVRLGINRDLGFSEADRQENIRRIGEVCKLFADAGTLVLASFISPYRRDRDRVRDLHRDAGLPFIEVFVDCPLQVAEARDPKGLYKKARKGEIPLFTGVSDPYEAPLAAECHLHSDRMSLDEEVATLVSRLREDGLLSAG